MAALARNPGSEACTLGVRVVVRPVYLPQQSRPSENQWVFAYRVRMVNESGRTVQLRTRHWTIVDADGERRSVDGEGVVGQQPLLEPGGAFEYTSFCPLETAWGTMEGTFRFEAMDHAEPAEFDAVVARFYLVS